MGLCKCPKRKVTNQFCFEHRVNVCEHCLVASHPKCVVKSYLHWLQDSDYTPVCLICNEDLSQGDCIRLHCYDVFHWQCLGQLALRIPPSSLKAELVCPVCKASLIPPDKLISPVADAVRQKLSTSDWGRKMLGLPPEEKKKEVERVKTQAVKSQAVLETTMPQQERSNVQPEVSFEVSKQPTKPTLHTTGQALATTQSSSSSSVSTFKHGRDKFYPENQTPHKVYDTRQDERVNIPFDHDENKYKKKGFFVWLAALLSLRKRPSRHSSNQPMLTYKRLLVLLVLVVVGFLTVILILSRVGRGFANTDPLLDPKANPNIHVDDTHFVS